MFVYPGFDFRDQILSRRKRIFCQGYQPVFGKGRPRLIPGIGDTIGVNQQRGYMS